ncbi:MAG: hypothetical protein M3O55_00635 [Actinomycetota bacterium]|nr:hypothetical protein [Actinomycetota bacterium]
MFVQVFQGQVSDPAAAHAALDKWAQELAPGATGWLGSTCGVTDDGTLIGLARFDSEESARRNSDRPEQDAWWAETSKLLTGEGTFHDSTDVMTMRQGGSDDAGFVQIIQGTAVDPERLRVLGKQFEDSYPDFRPDLLGSVIAVHDHDQFVQAAYFVSEDQARVNEAQDAPADAQPMLEEQMSLIKDPTFLDLRDPWLYSPR